MTTGAGSVLSQRLRRLALEPCKHRRAAHGSRPRRPDTIGLVVIHCTEGGTAQSVAAFFAGSSAQASTQLVVDDRECYRCVPDLVVPWGAPGANTRGLHVEHCGYARWTRDEWLEHDATLERSAAKAGRWAWWYRIPRRWLTVPDLRAGGRGFCTHHDATRAFHIPGGHTDPGAGFPKAHYMTLVTTAYAAIDRADLRPPQT